MRNAQQFPRAVEDLWSELRALEEKDSPCQWSLRTSDQHFRPQKCASPFASIDSSPAETESEMEEENQTSVNAANSPPLMLRKTYLDKLPQGRKDHPLMLVRALLTHIAGLNAFLSQRVANQIVAILSRV